MATLSELNERAEALVDDNIDSILLVDWYNQCLEELSNILYLPTRQTLTYDGTGFPIPDDYNGELKILTDVDTTVWEYYDNYIHFDGEEDYATIDVQYNRFPALITSSTTEIQDIPARFHSILVFYACMMYCHVEEEFDRQVRYEANYNKIYTQLNKYMSKTRPKPARWGVER